MRPFTFAPLLLALVVAAPARAEEPPSRVGFLDPGVRREARPRNMVLADLGLHVVGLGYQRTLGPRVALQVAADFYAPWTQYSKASTLLGAVVRGRAFFYPLAAAPAGLWISPFAQYGFGSAQRGTERRIGPVWAAGASVGYTIILGHRVAIALGGGAQFHAAYVYGGEVGPGFARFAPTADINVGYVF